MVVIEVIHNEEWQTYFSVCLGASFSCLDNHVETMTHSLTKMKPVFEAGGCESAA